MVPLLLCTRIDCLDHFGPGLLVNITNPLPSDHKNDIIVRRPKSVCGTQIDKEGQKGLIVFNATKVLT